VRALLQSPTASPARRLARGVPIGRADDAREQRADAWARRVPAWPTAEAAHGADVPLDPGTRATMGHAFSFDFAHVRIYADADAAREAASLGARAYTVGHRIGFAAGAYRPGTVAGQRPIACRASPRRSATTIASSPGASRPRRR
jgi:hypothetical protein